MAETTGLMPSRSKCGAVPRVVDPGDDPVDVVLLLRDLADQDVVLVVAGDGDHHLGPADAGPIEDPEFGCVAVLDVVLEFLLDQPGSGLREFSISVTSWPCPRSSRVRLTPTLPAPTTIRYMAQPPPPAAWRSSVLEHVDRDPGRADRPQALGAVPLGPQRIEDPGDHRLDLVTPLGDLRDHDVGVVAVGGGDEGVGLVDSGRFERIDLQCGADGEHATGDLPAAFQPDFEPGVGLGVLVEHGNGVAVIEHRAGQ